MYLVHTVYGIAFAHSVVTPTPTCKKWKFPSISWQFHLLISILFCFFAIFRKWESIWFLWKSCTQTIWKFCILWSSFQLGKVSTSSSFDTLQLVGKTWSELKTAQVILIVWFHLVAENEISIKSYKCKRTVPGGRSFFPFLHSASGLLPWKPEFSELRFISNLSTPCKYTTCWWIQYFLVYKILWNDG